MLNSILKKQQTLKLSKKLKSNNNHGSTDLSAQVSFDGDSAN